LRLDPKPRDFRELEAYRQGTGIEAMAETLRTGVMPAATVAGNASGSTKTRMWCATLLDR
jgi:hypothetical protein